MGTPLNDRQRERNGKEAALNAASKKAHERQKDQFFDRLSEKMEPIVREHLRKEGQTSKKFF